MGYYGIQGTRMPLFPFSFLLYLFIVYIKLSLLFFFFFILGRKDIIIWFLLFYFDISGELVMHELICRTAQNSKV